MDNEIYETDQSVCERSKYKLNNTEILLAVTKGQIKVEPQKMSPYFPGATLISESMITSLNQDIQRLGESKFFSIRIPDQSSMQS